MKPVCWGWPVAEDDAGKAALLPWLAMISSSESRQRPPRVYLCQKHVWPILVSSGVICFDKTLWRCCRQSIQLVKLPWIDILALLKWFFHRWIVQEIFVTPHLSNKHLSNGSMWQTHQTNARRVCCGPALASYSPAAPLKCNTNQSDTIKFCKTTT